MVDFIVQEVEWWFLVHDVVVAVRQEHVPEVGLVWGIGGQRVLSRMREYSMVGMKVRKMMVRWFRSTFLLQKRVG